jgi:hypothetical protein
MNTSVHMNVGCVYALYSLYITQPRSVSPVNIRITLNIWKILVNIHRDCLSKNITDPVVVFNKLIGSNAFVFTAVPPHLTQEFQEQDYDNYR